MRRSSRCSSFPNRALPPLPGLSLLVRSLLELLDLLGGREDELLPEDLLGGRDEDGLLEDEGLSDEGLPDPLDGRDEDGLSDDEGLPDPLGGRDEDGLSDDEGLSDEALLGGREELEFLLGLSGLSGLSDPDCLGVLPESLTI
jgi:hypothetical protein